MPRLCTFPVAKDVVHINPLQVLYIRPGKPANCLIHFAHDLSVGVDVGAEEVRRQIDVALNETTR